MVKTETPVCEFGKSASSFSLPDPDKKIWSLDQCKKENGLLVMFICNHCPYVKAIQTRLITACEALQQQGIGVVAINSNDASQYPEDSPEKMKEVAAAYQFNFPYLIDESQEVAKAYGAVCTPDFFGFNAKNELQYRGRFDSSGRESANESTQNELLDGMLQIAKTGQGPLQQIPSIGCSIKWRNE